MKLVYMLFLGIIIPVLIVTFIINSILIEDYQYRAQEDYNDNFVDYKVEETIEKFENELKKEHYLDGKSMYQRKNLDKLSHIIENENIQLIIFSQKQGLIYKSEKIKDSMYDNEVNNKVNFGIFPNNIREQYSIHKSYDIYMNTGDFIRVYLVTYTKLYVPQKYNREYEHLIIFFVFFIVYAILIFFVSRSIIKPLDKLKSATVKFSNGDYSYRINNYTNDKIGEVSKAFDYMFDEIEESHNMRKKYECNRKYLIASISHDLKTPLTAIKMNIAGIIDGIIKTEEAKKNAFSVIDNRIDYTQKLIEELFLFSKLDMDMEVFNYIKVSLDRFIEDVIEEWKMDYITKGIEFSYDFEQNNNFVMDIDVDKMKRVIVNILENSIKYSCVEKLKINITLRKSNTEILLIISDNGKGMNKTEVVNLFDQFYRGDISRNSKIEGSGLGLSIAKRIVQNHNGNIEAISDLGSGMRIIIKFPIERSN